MYIVRSYTTRNWPPHTPFFFTALLNKVVQLQIPFLFSTAGAELTTYTTFDSGPGVATWRSHRFGRYTELFSCRPDLWLAVKLGGGWRCPRHGIFHTLVGAGYFRQPRWVKGSKCVVCQFFMWAATSKKKKSVCGRPTEQAISVLSSVRGAWRRGKLESGFPLEAEIYISKANFIPHLKSMFEIDWPLLLAADGACVPPVVAAHARIVEWRSIICHVFFLSLIRAARAEHRFWMCSLSCILVLVLSFVRRCCNLSDLSCVITRGQQSHIFSYSGRNLPYPIK